jgi:GDPmannose 4,6-dehydratase
MYAVNGILFNHESPRRAESFVTRKITVGLGGILRGERAELRLGNLEAKRDWGFARDYMEGAWQMLQQDEPDDYVLATGEAHSVQEFLEEAFTYGGLDWRDYVQTDPRYFRPAEVDVLMGDYSKAKAKFGWEPKVRFAELVRMMVDADR